jgi:phytoene desaturase
MTKAIVIGAGFGGIAAALRLKAKGYDVTLLDRAKQLGGRAQTFEHQGFVFDAGPTVITAPHLFTELFELFDKDINDYVDIVPVAPWYRFYFPDGDTFDYGDSLEKTLLEIERIAPQDRDGYLELLKASEAIFDVGFSQLADKPFHSITTMFKQIPSLVKLKSYLSVWQFVCSHLKNDKLRQAFSIQPLLVGGNPFDTTCIYNLIHFLELKWGIHFAKGGMGAVVRALEKLMIEQGISIQLDTTIEKINSSHRQAHSVVTTKNETYDCDLVVSNTDPKHLYQNMIARDDVNVFAKIKAKFAKPSMGLYVLYFGTNKTYDEIAHHTIWLGKRYEGLLSDIFDKQVLADDFSLYLHRPTATDPSMAPDGCDSFYVLSPVPNLQGGQTWRSLRDSYSRKILKALEQTILPELTRHLVVQFDMTPDEFASDYLSVDGSGFSIAPSLSQSAWFRFHNRAEGLDNLYLTGAGTHPGAGVPGVLSSAKVLEHLIPSLIDHPTRI